MIQLLPMALVGGGVATGVNLYRRTRSKRVQRHLWLLPDQARLETDQSTASPLATAKATLKQVDDAYQGYVRAQIDPLFGAARMQQLEEMGVQGERMVLSSTEKQLNRNIAISLVVVATAVAAGQAMVPIVLICFPLALYISRPILQRAHHSVVHERRLTTSVVASVNAIATWVGGFYVAGGLGFVLYYLAEKLIYITEDNSRQRLANIFDQQPRFVWALIDGTEVEIPFAQLQVGDTMVIGAGQMIPVDGVITAGYGSIDQHRLTGEAQPAEKTVGDPVLAATMMLAGKIYVQVEKAGKATAAAQIGEILNNTAGYQMAIDSRAMKVVNASLAPKLAAAGLAWLLVSLEGAVAVTNASFGYNIRLTGPLAMLNYLNLAARRGILIKDGRSLEMLNEIDTVVFDKTGTLTLEQPQVAQIHLFNGSQAETVLALAAAVEARQSHPIACAIVAAAQAQDLPLPDFNDSRYQAGYGLTAWIEERLIHVGSERFMELEAIDLPEEVHVLQAAAHAQGHSLVMVALDDQLAGVIELQPTLRPEAKAVIAELHNRNIAVTIISGDQEAPTRILAETLGVDHYFANTLPDDKAGHVARLQSEGRSVCFVGDGINDAIALKQAKVSISLRGATTVATDTAQIVLMDTTLQQLPALFTLAGQFNANINTGFAVAIVPAFIVTGGVFLANMGLMGSLFMYNVSLLAGVGVAMQPLLTLRAADDE
ncbi:MAG: heavy metal translocating P-type ATPase [Caldilineaceae bacterium]|nr:heavy metal translocating P-type ATPase [Caldilineaceae bacterium]